jgi:Beta-propeller repeat
MQPRAFASALLVALTAFCVSSAASTISPESAWREAGARDVQREALTAYSELSLAFVRNAGQLDAPVRYSTQAGSTNVFLTRRAAVIALRKGRRGLALRLAFLGASPEVTIAGADRSRGQVNYFVGNDPTRWQTNLPAYEEVVYRKLWPGIDLAVGGRGGQLKYEFRLSPGADPVRISLAYRGQERVSLEPSGALRIETALGLLQDISPVSYQLVDGKRVAVASRFALAEGGAFGFALGRYDPSYPLVIDPGLVYSTYLGSHRRSEYPPGRLAVDAAGSAYVTGAAYSSDFPTTAGAFDTSFNGSVDIFVTKLSADGSALVYSTYLGGSGAEYDPKIAVDAAGSAYVTGYTSPADFPTTPGAFDRSHSLAYDDGFVTKLNADGSALAYSTYLGGNGDNRGSAIAVDAAGSAYVTGLTDSEDFPTTPGAFDPTFNGFFDAFVTKLNADGSALAYSTYLGGSGDDGNPTIAVDAAGSAYVASGTDSRDFPTTAGAFDPSYSGGRFPFHGDAFVTKLTPAGSALAYSTYLGGSRSDGASGIAVDLAGSAYVTGSTRSRNFPRPAARSTGATTAADWARTPSCRS